MQTTEMTMDQFDHILDGTLRGRSNSAAPAGIEQRLLARLANAEAAAMPVGRLFATSERVNARRGGASLWTAMLAHAAVFLVIFALAARHVQMTAAKPAVFTALELPPPPPPVAPRLERIGGGGGQQGPTPVTQGRLPELSQEQVVPPKAAPLEQPKLAVEPAVVVQKDLKMADNHMPNLGMPISNLKGLSMGNGSGTGIGSGIGAGIGPGVGGNTGGGVMHIGGSVHAPALLSQVEPEFSEEARKAKFSGNVQVYLWVDEDGRPSHVKVVRGVGMGLDEKAMEAVRQYRFKPAMLNGKAVKVDLYVDVNFQIF